MYDVLNPLPKQVEKFFEMYEYELESDAFTDSRLDQALSVSMFAADSSKLPDPSTAADSSLFSSAAVQMQNNLVKSKMESEEAKDQPVKRTRTFKEDSGDDEKSETSGLQTDSEYNSQNDNEDEVLDEKD